MASNIANKSVKKENRTLAITVSVILLISIIGSGLLFCYYYFFNYGKGEVEIDTSKTAPQNVILLIGDGMGLNHIEAGNIYTNDGMIMTTMPYQGEVVTRSLTVGVTDSAAAATTYATGNKTFNGCLSYLNGKNLTNMSEVIGASNKRFGVIATKSVTDATPAAFTAHNKSRSNHAEIALEQIQNSNIDLLFGLGKDYFDPYADLINTGDRAYVNTFSDLKACSADKVYAIFDDAIPTTGDFTLASLTSQALLKLECDEGFFLMVEGSKIDSYSHDNDMDNMLNELCGFNDAVKKALSYAKSNKNTTVIVLADHETGNLKLPKDATKDDLTDDCFNQGGHTGNNVGYFAYGPCANQIANEIDNTDIFYIIIQMLGLSA